MTVHECTILGLFKCMAIGRQGGSLLSIEIIIMWKLKGFKCPLS